MIEVLRRPVESTLTTVIGMQNRGLSVGVSSGDRHSERVDDPVDPGRILPRRSASAAAM
jgi:hypothetical protein